MTDTSSLSHLIERLERATGPDRETDLAIQLAIEPDGDIAGLMQFRRGFDGKPGMAWDIHHGGSVCFEKRDDGGRCFYNGGYPLPKYSSSIDAAMTLVPQSDDPTWRWRIVEFQEWNKGNSYWFWRARISGWPNMRPVYECGEHPISPIALCIASLKARLHDRD